MIDLLKPFVIVM